MNDWIKFLFLLCAFFCSCSTSGTDMDHVDSPPGWWYERSVNCFYGSAVGDSLRDAELSAIEKAFETAEKEFKIKIDREYLLVLLNQRSADNGIRIDKSAYMNNEDGVCSMVCLSIPEQFVNELNPELAALRKAGETEISRLCALAGESYRNLNDTQAINYLLSAVREAEKSKIYSGKYGRDELFDRAFRMLARINLTIDNFDHDRLSGEIYVRRKANLIADRVKKASLKFVIENEDGGELFSQFFVTDDSGYLDFSTTFHSTGLKGRVKLIPDVGYDRTYFGKFGKRADDFARLIDEKTVSADFSATTRKQRVLLLNSIVAMGDSLPDLRRLNKAISDSVKLYRNISYETVDGETGEILGRLSASGRLGSFDVVVVNLAVYDGSKRIEGEVAIHMTGGLALYDAVTLELIKEYSEMEFVGIGSSEDEAFSDFYAKYGHVVGRFVEQALEENM